MSRRVTLQVDLTQKPKQMEQTRQQLPGQKTPLRLQLQELEARLAPASVHHGQTLVIGGLIGRF